ncbi:MAG TPA: zf-HC2 domain-containing protein [Pyrinomonadaceae bacterium]|nr:zf-HC2 domain-containing protein [Pyrinomonadaceae bacterium]
MVCEDVNQSLSAYIDDAVTLPARVALEEHLEGCPVCRDEVVKLRSLTRGLAGLSVPPPPADLATTISNALMIEAAARRQAPHVSVAQKISRFLEPRLFPYSVGSMASLILFVSMFVALRPHFIALHEAAAQDTGVFVIPGRPGQDITQPVTSENFAASRAPFAAQSPSLNPKGALAMLTQSYANPHPNDLQYSDDMIVVADVFSNGSASLAGVVNAPRNRRMLNEFEVALRQDAAFVPASMDRRPDTMRVVFTVQKVDVRERNF